MFAICTCGGYEIVNAVPALQNLAHFTKAQGFRLAAEYTVRLPMNNLDYEHIPVPIETDSATIIRESQAQIDDILDRIIRNRQGRHHVARRCVTVALTPMYAAMANASLKALRRIAHEPADSPLDFRELIPLTDRSIGPRGAVHHWGRPNGAKYHHPEVKAKELTRGSGALPARERKP